jgi:hypothetical protein
MEKDANFGDCTKCKHCVQVAEHEWDCVATDYDIETKKCWKNRGDTMEWVNFKVKEGEREKLKNDAHAHRMNISEYLRWLIDKQRKEDEGK